MTRLFLRIFYMTFLWLILLANLLFAFDLVTTVTPFGFGMYNGDLSNKYFGVSTLITAFKNIDNWPLGKATNWIRQVQDYFFKWGNRLMLQNEWPQFSTANNFWEGFLMVLEVVANIAKMIASIAIYVIGFLYMCVYFIMVVLTIAFSLINLLTGYYASELPSTISSTVSNCITPLLTAV